jgi:hypothetical protein
MTEDEWEACSDPTPMLESLHGKASDRKLRLFASACCRRIWSNLTDERSRSLVEASEQFVEGALGVDALTRTFEEAADAQEGVHHEGGDQDAAESVLGLRDGLILSQVIEGATESAAYTAVDESWESITNPAIGKGKTHDEKYEDALASGRAREKAGQASLIRCIFGNQFCPASLDPAWLAWNGGTVASLATAIYDHRRFADLPVLADALEDAGCADAAILAHCRGPDEHVRGCWVVDLLTGRE